MDLEVGDHVCHGRMLRQSVQFVGRDLGGKTLECMAVDVEHIALNSVCHTLGSDRMTR